MHGETDIVEIWKTHCSKYSLVQQKITPTESILPKRSTQNIHCFDFKNVRWSVCERSYVVFKISIFFHLKSVSYLGQRLHGEGPEVARCGRAETGRILIPAKRTQIYRGFLHGLDIDWSSNENVMEIWVAIKCKEKYIFGPNTHSWENDVYVKMKQLFIRLQVMGNWNQYTISSSYITICQN